MSLVEKLESKIKAKKLLRKGDSFIIGVSGGVDSVTLLYCLNKLSKKWKFNIVVAHLNHGLRKDSKKDALFVKNMAKKYGFPFYVSKVRLPKSNIEEAGRNARYDFFEEVKKETKSKYIVTAHNFNDNVETILLNLTRGTGLEGLSGMKEKDNDLVRPFLSITRVEIEDFARKNKLKWREDPINMSLKFSRNRIRHKVIPELLKINEKTPENILRSSENLREIDFFLEKEANGFLKKNQKGNTLSLKNFNTLENPLKKKVLRGLIKKTKENLTNIDKSHLENILELTKKSGTKEVHLPSGLIIVKEYDKLRFEKDEKKEPEITGKLPLKTDKKLLFSKFIISSSPVKRPGNTKEDSVYVDVDKTGDLFVRSRSKGDRVAIGKTGSKKLKDLFIDRKIPKKERDYYPILVSEKDEPVWVPRLRLSDKFRAEKSSKRIINLKVKNEK